MHSLSFSIYMHVFSRCKYVASLSIRSTALPAKLALSVEMFSSHSQWSNLIVEHMVVVLAVGYFLDAYIAFGFVRFMSMSVR